MKNTASLTPGILVAIAIGAVLGALSREGLAFFANSPEPQAFPWGTLIANLSGAFLLGLFATYLDRIISHALFRPLWEIGFIRSFTTLSTFSLEGIRHVCIFHNELLHCNVHPKLGEMTAINLGASPFS